MQFVTDRPQSVRHIYALFLPLTCSHRYLIELRQDHSVCQGLLQESKVGRVS